LELGTDQDDSKNSAGLFQSVFFLRQINTAQNRLWMNSESFKNVKAQGRELYTV
jgi:hypothetical protein